MSDIDYWADGIESELTQGDLLQDVWVGSSVSPRRALESGNMKNTTPTWEECGSALKPNHSGLGHFLARGRSGYAIVISHSCEIDKPRARVLVLVAQVTPLSQLNDATTCENIRQGRRQAFLFLPGIENIFPESYADLRTICYLDKTITDSCVRLRSVTQNGMNLLQCQIVSFVTRIKMDSIIEKKHAAAQTA